MTQGQFATKGEYPAWVPDAARHYLAHTEHGTSIRALARAADCHASTILRQVRRYEGRRDDPLVDDALKALAIRHSASVRRVQKENGDMNLPMKQTAAQSEDDGKAPLTRADIEREALRILRRLCEGGAVLAVAREMDMAVVVRDGADGASMRTAVAPREVAQAMALRDWINCSDSSARIMRYHITAAGRSALKQLVADAENKAVGLPGTSSQAVADEGMPRSRYALGESPLTGLARRRDRDGQPFLSRDLVAVGERLREDFELATMGPKVTTDWTSYLTGPVDGASGSANVGGLDAKARVGAALAELGPGLGDVVLRCCCFLEGLETAERKMGWAARSGKIVLRIALQRLKRYYEDQGKYAPKIG